MKSLNLPEPIAAYFEADKRDGQAVAGCFTQDGVVRDEGHTYVGAEEIDAWKTDASSRFTYTTLPFSLTNQGDERTVSATVSGNFPGSPAVLQYTFLLENGKIRRLEITP